MTVATIFADADDDGLQSFEFGGVYTDARDGNTAVILQGSTSTSLNAGQLISGANYEVFQAAEDFDTSSIGTGQAISSAVLSLFDAGLGINGNGRQLDAVLYDFGAAVDTGDFQNGAAVAALPLLAHIASAGWVANAYNALTDDAFAANVSPTGHTRILLVGDDNRTSTPPTGSDAYSFFAADQTGTTNDPKLVVTYSAAKGIVRRRSVLFAVKRASTR